MKMKKTRIYAYVTNQGCLQRLAYRPGEDINWEPVSRNGDLNTWTHGKRETLKIAAGSESKRVGAGADLYWIRTAKAVAEMLDWTV